jgi:hypothetical protein
MVERMQDQETGMLVDALDEDAARHAFRIATGEEFEWDD